MGIGRLGWRHILGPTSSIFSACAQIFWLFFSIYLSTGKFFTNLYQFNIRNTCFLDLWFFSTVWNIVKALLDVQWCPNVVQLYPTVISCSEMFHKSSSSRFPSFPLSTIINFSNSCVSTIIWLLGVKILHQKCLNCDIKYHESYICFFHYLNHHHWITLLLEYASPSPAPSRSYWWYLWVWKEHKRRNQVITKGLPTGRFLITNIIALLS